MRPSVSPPPLLPQLWPLTGAYAFLDAAVDDVVEELVDWRRTLALEPKPETVRGPLPTLLDRLHPMSLGHRELLVRTDSSWTAYFSDQRTGADEAPVGHLARRLRCRALYLVRWPPKRFEALRFQLFADHETDFLNHERTVEVNVDDDGRRVFTATGRVQPFEHPEAYTARRILERLTPSLVDEYGRALGIRAFDPAYFADDGVLVTSRDPAPDVRFSIADQQARYGYVPPAS